MRYLLCILMYVSFVCSVCAVSAPITWPPSWVGDADGDSISVEGVGSDDHSGFDYGTDSYGYWANFEIVNAGNIVATIEMRYIEPADFEMGAPANEQGARGVEMSPLSPTSRKSVAKGKLNGGAPFWISAEECSQNLWEEAHMLSDATFAMKLKSFDNSDIEDENTASFPIKISRDDVMRANLAENPFTAQGYPADKDDVTAWKAAVVANFQKDYDTYKEIRALESQTFSNCDDFCSTTLKTAIESSAGIALGSAPRLPTEEEWEFVCRAETQTAFWTGRLLNGVSIDTSLMTINKNDFFFNYAKADIEANAMSLPGGDGDRHPEWYTSFGWGWGSHYDHLRPEGMDLNGLASMGHPEFTIGGELTVSGGEAAVKGAANFDERYQHRYKADYYGDLTSILMVYTNSGDVNNVHDFKQDPYAATDATGRPTGGDTFYRFLRDDQEVVAADFISCSSLTAANTTVNQRYVDIGNELKPGLNMGDWYLGEQLQYREMVPITVRFNGSGVEEVDGLFIKDERGTLYPIRSQYVEIAYWNGGAEAGSTWPPRSVNDGLEKDIRNADLSAAGDPAMSTDEYVQAVIDTFMDDAHVPDLIPVGGWYSGATNYTVVDIDGNSHNVALKNFKMYRNAGSFDDEIEINYVSTPSASFPALAPNPWGLRNVHGNVAEWTSTRWDGKSNHDNHVNGAYRVTKGGSWKYGADQCRSAARVARDPAKAYDDVGFRFIIE